jgi:hypothetical protein
VPNLLAFMFLCETSWVPGCTKHYLSEMPIVLLGLVVLCIVLSNIMSSNTYTVFIPFETMVKCSTKCASKYLMCFFV